MYVLAEHLKYFSYLFASCTIKNRSVSMSFRRGNHTNRPFQIVNNNLNSQLFGQSLQSHTKLFYFTISFIPWTSVQFPYPFVPSSSLHYLPVNVFIVCCQYSSFFMQESVYNYTKDKKFSSVIFTNLSLFIYKITFEKRFGHQYI